MFSAYPELIGQVALTEWLIASSAVPVYSSSACGGLPDTMYPNNSSGWGRVDALNALIQGQNGVYFPLISGN
jgi:urea transporter